MTAAGRRLRPRGAVISDVARLAGVSHQTVSRVLNDSGKVRAQTRERVLAAMRELDYRPNPMARALATGRSRTLGVVSVDTMLFGPASALFGVEQAAHAAGYFITIVSLKVLDSASVRDAVERLRTQGVDGILAIAPQEGAEAALADLPANVPVVAVDAGQTASLPAVTVDHAAGAAAATELLLGLGHRTVWHVSGPPDSIEARQRARGWRSALAAAGAEAPPLSIGDWSARSGYRIGCGLAGDPAVTAIFVANDQMALGVLRALHAAGRAIPDDVSVVGFDDIPEAGYFTPPLTTVRQDFDEVGRSSLGLLLEVIHGDGRRPARRVLTPTLVLRDSTAAQRPATRAT
jgi:DNA-binding LacI/PurR family transcriptional regulator